MVELANRIAQYRKQANLTQKDLGDMLNISPQAVSKWENGQAEPDASTIIKLCEIFKISTDELLGNIQHASESAVTAAADAVAESVAEAQPEEIIQPAVETVAGEYTAEPQYEEAQYVEPQYVEAQYAEPQIAEQYVEPQYETPRYENPQYKKPQQYVEPRQTVPQYGAPQYGTPQHTEPQPATQKIINGYCEICNKPVGPGEYVVETRRGSGQHIYCKQCKEKRNKLEREIEYSSHKGSTVKSLIWGGIAGVIALVAVLLLLLIGDPYFPKGAAVVISLIAGISYFAFIMQMFWDGVVNDMFFLFIKSFKMPGVIFTLDLDGLLFLLFVKIGGAILGAMLSVLLFLLGLIIMPIASLMILPFASLKRIIENKKLKSQAEK